MQEHKYVPSVMFARCLKGSLACGAEAVSRAQSHGFSKAREEKNVFISYPNDVEFTENENGRESAWRLTF